MQLNRLIYSRVSQNFHYVNIYYKFQEGAATPDPSTFPGRVHINICFLGSFRKGYNTGHGVPRLTIGINIY